MCQKKGTELTEHHVVEAPDKNGKAQLEQLLLQQVQRIVVMVLD